MVLLSIILLTGLIQPSMAENTLHFCSAAGIPPLSYADSGMAKGFFIDLLREISMRAGYDTEVKLYPVKRMESYLESGEVDGATALVQTEKREKYLIYSNTPVMVSRLTVFVRKGEEFPFKSVNDLKGKKIGFLLGYRTDSYELEKSIREGSVTVEEAVGYDQNLKKLIKGRVDCILTTEQLTWYHANELGIAGQITALDPPLSSHSVFIAVSKNTKNINDVDDFMRRINAAFNTVVSDGTYMQLQKRYKVISLQ